ncbi:MAG: hypothetical protein ACE5JI_15175 [Acidobacteriota bacterium]
MANSVRERFIQKIATLKKVERVPGVASVYTTFNEVWLYVRYASLNKLRRYWFDIDTYKIREWQKKRRFIVCFVCGDENTVVFLPDDRLLEWYEGIEPNRKGHWMVNIFPRDDRLVMKISADRPEYDLTEYLNRYDFISRSVPESLIRQMRAPLAPSQPLEQVKDQIMAHPELQGDSLHDRVCDMLAHIGRWMGYTAEKGYKVAPDSPYQLDAAWLRNDLLEVAAEVQIGGSEAEAKDRLIHARRFGARKVIVVSGPESIARLKSICRHEPELKNWLQIWGVPKLYQMYLSGHDFFELFRPFERQQWAEEVTEFL